MKAQGGSKRLFRGALWAALGALILWAAPVFPQEAKPDFSGHWQLDKEKSDFGSLPPLEDVTEDIDHHEPTLLITTVTKTPGGEMKRSVKYTTDDVENTNTVAGHTMKTKTHWEGASLVTVIRDENGLQITEVRSLSKDGKTQTIASDFGTGKLKLVMVKKQD